MRGFALRQGMVFDWNGTGFRIDRLQPNGDVLLERIEDGQLSLIARDRLLADYSQGCISGRSTDAGADAISNRVFSRPLDELPEAVRSAAGRRRHYLRAILEHGDIVFTSAYLQPLIQAAATEIGDPKPPSVATIHRWYSRYRVHQDSRALIPRFDRRGPRNVRQEGRVLQLTGEAIEEAFKASPKATGRGIYVRLATQYLVGDWLKTVIDELDVPTVLLGLPRTEQLLQVNEQLRRRFSQRRNLQMGQDPDTPIETECLQLFVSLGATLPVSINAGEFGCQHSRRSPCNRATAIRSLATYPKSERR